MNNIQKSFKKKSELRAMADGGPAKPRPQGSYFGGRQQQLDEALGERTPPRAPKPDFSNVESKVTTTAQQPKKKSAIRTFLGLADGGMPKLPGIFSADEIDNFNAMGSAAQGQASALQQAGHRAAAAGLANAQPAAPNFGAAPAELEPPEEELADGGDVKGKGGPTDDKVGPVALSDGEYVLPADTVDAVGVDVLDELRLATHDFKDTENRPKIPGRLRGMAAGGVFYVDPDGTARRGAQPSRAMVPAQPQASQLPATQNAAPRAAPAAEPLRAQVLGSSPPPDPSRMSQLRQAANTGGGRVGGFLRGAAPIQMTAGALGTLGDTSSGYRDSYNSQLGISRDAGLPKQVAGDTARVMENVGDTLTFGLAGKLGRGIGSALAGGSFGEGWSGPSQRDRFAASQTPAAPAAAAERPASNDAASYGMPNQSLFSNNELARSDSARYNAAADSEVIGSFNGRPITKGESDARAASLQTASFQPPAREASQMDQMRSLLREFGGGGGSGGGFAPRSNARDINERYDRLSSQLSGMYSRKGQGNLARHLVNLESQRAGALDADARNLTSARGQDMQSAASAASNRTSALQAVSSMMERQQNAAAKAQSDAAKLQAEAQEGALKRDEQGLTDIREAVRARFGEDSALAESTLSRILSAGQDQIGRVTSLTGQDRAAAIEDLLDSATAAQSFDDQQSSLWGNTDSGLPRATETRDPRFFRDVFAGGNRALPALGRELKDLVGLDGRVMVDDNGRVAPLSDDLRQRRTQRRAEEDAPRRSRLRDDN